MAKTPASDALTLAGWASQVQTGTAKQGAASALMADTLASAEKQKALNAYITLNPKAAEQAKAADAKIGKGGALAGATIAVKDNFCTAGILTTAGSKILSNFTPTYESHVTQRLLDAGAVFVGKANMDEFGMGSSTEFSAYGAAINPLGVKLGRDNLSPGGSSGGSAAAVAAGLCLAATGTDTGGSIRQPASFCGVVGFKPTYGVCSRWGVIAYASSLDQAGVVTRNVDDAALMMSVIAGHDPRDSTSLTGAAPDFLGAVKSASGKGVKVGVVKAMREKESSKDLANLWTEIERRLKQAGAEIVYIDLPTLDASLPAYYIIALSEASSNLARYDGVRYGYRDQSATGLKDMYELSRERGFGDEVKRRILLGAFSLSAGYYDAFYGRASRVRAKFRAELDAAFKSVDFMVWPSAPTTAFELGAHTGDPLAMYLEDAFTVPVNLAGVPAISIPGIIAGDGLPMGFQVIGPRQSDAQLMGFAKVLESVAS